MSQFKLTRLLITFIIIQMKCDLILSCSTHKVLEHQIKMLHIVAGAELIEENFLIGLWI